MTVAAAAAADQVLYLVRVVSAKCFEALGRQPESERQLTSTLGYNPALEFPGVCASLVTEKTLQAAQETLYPGQFMLFLDARLLSDRTDYHFNVSDQNGHIGIDTVYPWNLLEFVASGQLSRAIAQCSDDFFGTEVVFHNPIPWSSVVRVEIKHYKFTPTLPNTVLRAPSVDNFCNFNYLPYFALPPPPEHNAINYTKNKKMVRCKEQLLKQAFTVLMQGHSSDELYVNRHLQNIHGFEEMQKKIASLSDLRRCSGTLQPS